MYAKIYFDRCANILWLFICFVFLAQNISGQIYYGWQQIDHFYHVNLDDSYCPCINCCQMTEVGTTISGGGGLTMDPSGNLYSIDGAGIYQINVMNGFPSSIMSFGQVFLFEGLVTFDGNTFYTIIDHAGPIPDSLVEINVNNLTIINLGEVPYRIWGDLFSFNGIIYYGTRINLNPVLAGIVELDINNPEVSSLVVTYPGSYGTIGLTASGLCHTILSTDIFNNKLFLLNLLDGAIIPYCDVPPYFVGIVSIREFNSPNICDVALDLDCDDSSGATDADFNSPEFSCLSAGVPICDEDIGMLYDAIISSMTIQITGSVPDAPNEILVSTGPATNINVSGSGTTTIILTNAGGARSTDFKDALRLIRYQNTAVVLTPGLRTIQAQFTTESGSMSNIATAYIHVISLPVLPVDLGADVQICEGETATFNAGNPGAIYTWNTGSHTQSITTGQPGEYIVTVSNGIQCPNQDTVELEVLPLVHVSLSGDDEICDNEQAHLVITTDSPFPLDIEITPDPGSPFVLSDVQGTHTFFDLPLQNTLYTITHVTPLQDACVEITQASHEVQVFPSYQATASANLCEGDSIWLGYYWETEAGVYEIPYDSQFGCDSIVTYTITIDPVVTITVHATTCDPSAAGTFITHLDNPNGCDTILTTTVSLLPSDTIRLFLQSCQQTGTGVVTQTLINQAGCDSIIITTTSYIPPADTTSIIQTTCDSSLVGTLQQLLTGADGCDSLVVTTINIAPADTTYLTGISCDPASIGVTQSLFNNQNGCDSLVITTIVAGRPDTTLVFTTSCDPNSLGVFETHYSTAQLCDSTVITTVSYSAQDSTFLQSGSCDPNELVYSFSNLSINSDVTA